MATIINSSKVSHQMFKCYNCGRKTVSLGSGLLVTELKLEQIEDDDLDESSVLEALELLQDEWLATCNHCGWSDS